MGGQEQRAAVLVHDRLNVLEAVDANPSQGVLQGSREQRGELDDHESEVLKRATADPPAGIRGDVGEGAREVRERGLTAPGRQHVADVAQPAADPPGSTRREPADSGGQRTERTVDGEDCLRRSRMISTAIGITDSTITTITTTWM